MRVVVGITGASGAVYACALLGALNSLNIDLEIVVSEMGRRVLSYECSAGLDDLARWGAVHDNSDLFSVLASGSAKFDAMVIVPCSANTLSALANGLGGSLLLRAASVALKERRNLIVVMRETPLNLIIVENMAALIKAGALILPASPGFYTRPVEIWQLVGGIVGRIIDNLGIDHALGERWTGGEYNEP
ncbi:MAG: UbiX family flavin prenyltransferase [Acidaminococcales bacterium]|jgi:4-hydroxy-3-polyprenylbenzoate decarboxylase|nr:UbiX family flavin prenyltransferase [Acidaminococcales bacterium]